MWIRKLAMTISQNMKGIKNENDLLTQKKPEK